MAQLGMAASAMICGALLFYVLYGLWTPLLQICPFGRSSSFTPWPSSQRACCSGSSANSFPSPSACRRPKKSETCEPPHLLGKLSLSPVIVLGNWIGQWFLKERNLDVTNEIDMAHSEDEIRMLITASHREGKLNSVESELIGNVFDFADRLAKEIMVPRQDIVCLFAEETMNQHLKTIRQSRHTRYPLCAEDKDHILGLIHIKDFMDLYIHKKTNLSTIKRPILLVPEIMPASQLLQLMRERRTYLSIVVDEYGSTVGLIDLEDIMEELVGSIQNEHSREREEIVALNGGAYEFDGTVLLEDVEELLHIPVEEDVDADTIGGYVFYLLGHTPAVNDAVMIGSYQFKVKEVQGFRIARLKAIPVAQEKEAPHDDE